MKEEAIMPNNCVNTLIVTKEVLPELVEKYIHPNEAGRSIFDFDRIIPIGDVPNWYDQRLAKWGTKWVGYDVSVGDDRIDFFTAWAPPIPIVEKLAELHHGTVFRLEYYECGMAFRGVATAEWRGDEVILEEDEWNMTEEDFAELELL
jgi:hypothetical protein